MSSSFNDESIQPKWIQHTHMHVLDSFGYSLFWLDSNVSAVNFPILQTIEADGLLGRIKVKLLRVHAQIDITSKSMQVSNALIERSDSASDDTNSGLVRADFTMGCLVYEVKLIYKFKFLR